MLCFRLADICDSCISSLSLRLSSQQWGDRHAFLDAGDLNSGSHSCTAHWVLSPAQGHLKVIPTNIALVSFFT